jgi:hypothetical protein
MHAHESSNAHHTAGQCEVVSDCFLLPGAEPSAFVCVCRFTYASFCVAKSFPSWFGRHDVCAYLRCTLL